MALFGLLGGKKTSAGLDIGSGIINVAVIDHSRKQPEFYPGATPSGRGRRPPPGGVGAARTLGVAARDQSRLRPGSVDNGNRDGAGADVQAGRGFFAAKQPKQGHDCLGVRERVDEGKLQ